jgi:arsenical pump membrane protein
LNSVLHVVSGAGLTIVATILMSSVLERAGFFRWAAFQIAHKAQGSGKVLFFLTLLLSFFMTIFFNNDGSILITTPIILEITQRLRFNKKQSLPYLLGGALIATASSAPIGVSNLANLIALASVGLDLNQYAELMLIPSLLGIGVCAALLYMVFRHNIPRQYRLSDLADEVFPPRPGSPFQHPPRPHRAPRGHPFPGPGVDRS